MCFYILYKKKFKTLPELLIKCLIKCLWMFSINKVESCWLVKHHWTAGGPLSVKQHLGNTIRKMKIFILFRLSRPYLDSYKDHSQKLFNLINFWSSAVEKERSSKYEIQEYVNKLM